MSVICKWLFFRIFPECLCLYNEYRQQIKVNIMNLNNFYAKEKSSHCFWIF